MTLQNVLQAAAEKLKARWPDRKVYVENIPQKADGCFYLELSNMSQNQGLDRRHRRTMDLQVLYFRKDGDAFAYLDWAEVMLDEFRSLRLAGASLPLRNRKLRNDEEGRYYQFLGELSILFVEATESGDPMEGLSQKEETK